MRKRQSIHLETEVVQTCSEQKSSPEFLCRFVFRFIRFLAIVLAKSFTNSTSGLISISYCSPLLFIHRRNRQTLLLRATRNEMLNVILFGATGATGKALADILTGGKHATKFVNHPDALSPDSTTPQGRSRHLFAFTRREFTWPTVADAPK